MLVVKENCVGYTYSEKINSLRYTYIERKREMDMCSCLDGWV